MTADLAMMPAHELVKLYKARKASPVEAVRATFARIERSIRSSTPSSISIPTARCAPPAPRRNAGRRAASG